MTGGGAEPTHLRAHSRWRAMTLDLARHEFDDGQGTTRLRRGKMNTEAYDGHRDEREHVRWRISQADEEEGKVTESHCQCMAVPGEVKGNMPKRLDQVVGDRNSKTQNM